MTRRRSPKNSAVEKRARPRYAVSQIDHPRGVPSSMSDQPFQVAPPARVGPQAHNHHAGHGPYGEQGKAPVENHHPGNARRFGQNETEDGEQGSGGGERQGDDWLLDGVKCFVTDPEAADFFVVAFRTGDGADELALAVVDADAPGVSAQSFPMMDTTKRLGNVSLENVRVPANAILAEPGRARPALDRLFDRGAIAVTAELLGSAQAALDMTIAYAKERIQFGSPIGRFQGVKHPLAEMFVALESSKSLLYYAAWAIDAKPDDVPRAVSRAKAYASDTFIRIGVDGVQLHGTIAFTDEYDLQLYLKRSKWARPMFGDSAYHYERLLRLRGL